MWPNPQETVDLVTFTEEILKGNFIFCVVLVTNTMLIFERCPTKHIYYDAYNYMLYSLRDKCNFSCNW